MIRTPYERFLDWKRDNPGPFVSPDMQHRHVPKSQTPQPRRESRKMEEGPPPTTSTTRRIKKKKLGGLYSVKAKRFSGDIGKVSAELISADHFVIHTKNLVLPEKIQRLINYYHGHFNTEKGHWRVSLGHFESVVEQLQVICDKEQVQFDRVPPFVLKALEYLTPFEHTKGKTVHYDYRKDNPTYDLSRELPEHILKKMYQFQKDGVNHALQHHGRVLIGDEMGLGKTVQALAISYVYREDWPLLILSPSLLRFTWQDEIEKWLPMIPKSQIEVISNSKTAFTSSAKIYIMSYDLAKNVEKVLHLKHFKIAIADEVHYLKSKDAKRSRILSPLLSRCKRVILVSGTPILARPQEVFNIVNILRPDLFPEFYQFGRRYCDPKQGRYGMDWSGCDHSEELHFILSQVLMIRRLKDEVLTELPKKLHQKIPIEADQKLSKQISDLLKKRDN